MILIPFAFVGGGTSAEIVWPSNLKGINLSGGSDMDEWWSFPSTTAIDYYVDKGFNFFRVPFRWERLQHTLGGALDATHLGLLEDVVDYALANGAEYVMLVAHNFGGRVVAGGSGAIGTTEEKIGGGTVTRAHFADFWGRVADVFKDRPEVIFDLMNEPESMPSDGYVDGTMQMLAAYNDAIAAIRATGATNFVVLEGHGWNNAQSFGDNWYGTENSVAFAGSNVVDSLGKWIVSVHNYPDTPHGDEGNAVSATALKDRFADVLTWAIAEGRPVMVGEFATHTADPNGEAVVTDFVDHLAANAEHVVGWCWWEGRSRLATSAEYNIEWDPAGADDAKLGWLFPSALAAPTLVSASHSTFDTARTSGVVLTVDDTLLVDDVLVDGASVAFETIDATRLVATVPAHAAGAFNVVASGPGGASAPIAVEAWDPSAEASCSWYAERDFASKTWTPRVGTAPTLVGSVVEMNKEPVFDGSGHFTGPNVSTLLSNAHGTLATVVEPSVAPTDAVPTPYENAAFFGRASSGPISLWTSTLAGAAQFGFSCYDSAGAYRWARAATADLLSGGYRAVIGKYEQAVSIAISVDGAAFSTEGASSALSGHTNTYDGPVSAGVQYDAGTRKYRGGVRVAAIFDVAFTDAQAAKFNAWARSTHGVANGTAPRLDRIDRDVFEPGDGCQILITGKYLSGANPHVYAVSSSGVYPCTVDSVSDDGTATVITVPATPSGALTIVFVTDDGVGQLAHAVEAWTYTDESNVWVLRADQGVTTASGNVTLWEDQGDGADANRNGVAASAEEPPFNASDPLFDGQPTIGPFDGAERATTGTWAVPFSEPFLLGVIGSTDKIHTYFATPAANPQHLAICSIGDSRRVYGYPNGDTYISGEAQRRNLATVIVAEVNGASSKLYAGSMATMENATSLGVGNQIGDQPLYVGNYRAGGGYGAGRLAEKFAIAGAPTSALIRKITRRADARFFRTDGTNEALSASLIDYAAAPWPGTPSAGTSGADGLRPASGYSYPSAGPTLNGHPTARYNGTTDATQFNLSARPVSYVLGTGAAYSFGFLAYIPTPGTDSATVYNNAAGLSSSGLAYCGLHFRSSGTVSWVSFDGAHKTATTSIVYDQWNYIQVEKHATNGIRIRVNGGAWSAYTAAGNFTDATEALVFGRASTGAGGALLEMDKAHFWAEQRTWSAEEFDRKLAEVRATFCLALR